MAVVVQAVKPISFECSETVFVEFDEAPKTFAEIEIRETFASAKTFKMSASAINVKSTPLTNIPKSWALSCRYH